MQRDDYNEIEDFLDDPSFREWTLYKQDKTNWVLWVAKNPHKFHLVQQAQIMLLAMRVDEAPVTLAETQDSLTTTWEKIKLREQNSQEKKPSRYPLWWKGVAAVLILGLVFARLYQFLGFNAEKDTTPILTELADNLVRQTNQMDKPQLIMLSDSSSIMLQPKSTLSYPKVFDLSERRVHLSGEAFFEVKKDANQPFLVFSSNIVTRVVGTSFRIIAYEKQPNVEVRVRTGQVNISSSNHSSERSMTLLPKEGLRFNKEDQEFKKLPEPLLGSSAKEISRFEDYSFDFKDAPVSQIFSTIERAYWVTIEYPQLALNNCYLSTSLNDEPLPEKLRIICESLGNNTNYEFQGNTIRIISKGCN